MTCSGLLLAAGAGRRFGGPKALAVVSGHPLVLTAVNALRKGGCTPIHVVTGASAEEVESLLPKDVTAVRAPDWELGMSASLRAGMHAATGDSVLIHLVDLPDVGADVIARIRERAAWDSVVRAAYGGVPGHPVLVGRKWWREFTASLSGDQGAREWLRDRVTMIECADLATGSDLDVRRDHDR